MSYRYRGASSRSPRRTSPTPAVVPPAADVYRRGGGRMGGGVGGGRSRSRSRSPYNNNYTNGSGVGGGGYHQYGGRTNGYGRGGGGDRYGDRGMDRYGGDRAPRRRSRSYDRYAGGRDGGSGGGGGGRDYMEEADPCRLHIGDLNERVTQYDLERAFSRFGELQEVWMARNPPSFAFIVFRDPRGAATALREMDGRMVGSCRVRVTMAKPRSRGMRNRWDPEMRCYQCGEKGHFARDCPLNPVGYSGGGGGGSSRGSATGGAGSASGTSGASTRRYERSDSRERESRPPRSQTTQSPSRASYPRHTSRSRSPRRDYSNYSNGYY